MINYKAVVFDMDGVLIDATEWHFLALNEALSYFGIPISVEDHINEFNGLSTATKLKMLSVRTGLPEQLHGVINRVKQDRTLRYAAQNCYPSPQHQILLSRLKSKGMKIGICTNSIRKTSEFMLDLAKVSSYVDFLITNEDVNFPKPNPEGYLKICSSLNLLPSEVIVVEDGEYGIEAASKAGCRVLSVSNPGELNIELFLEKDLGIFDE